MCHCAILFLYLIVYNYVIMNTSHY